MKKMVNYIINFAFLLGVVAVAFSIATIALTRKVNQAQVYTQNLHGTVNKQKVTVLTLTSGIITKIYVKNGQTVKQGDLLVQMDNPVLQDSYNVYAQHVNNESAQTQASIAQVGLDNLKIFSPVNGVVSEIDATEGSSVHEFTKIMVIDSSSDIRLEANLTAAQYQKAQKLQQVKAYSSRLTQDFIITPSLLKADEANSVAAQEKKIGLYFTFNDASQAAALLNNEDLDIKLDDNSQTQKPIDIFVKFWNGLLAKS